MKSTKSEKSSSESSYKAKINELEGRISTLNKQLDAKNAEVETLTKASNADSQTKAQITQLQNQINELTKREAAAQQELANVKKQKEAAESKYSAQMKDLSDESAAMEKKISTLQKQVADLTAKNAELAKANTTNNNSDATLINGLQAQVKAQSEEIARLEKQLANKDAELKAAKKNNTGKTSTKEVNAKLQELQALCDSYAAEIAQLKAENAQLKAENADLKNTIAENAAAIAQSERLSHKIEMASVLVTNNLKVTPGKSVSGTVVKETKKASQTKVVKVEGEILQNNVIDPGTITIYYRIANAANRVVCAGIADDFMFNLNGTQMQFTAKQDIEYTGAARNIRLIWRTNDQVTLEPGLYWVTLYANGYEIGKTSFRLV